MQGVRLGKPLLPLLQESVSLSVSGQRFSFCQVQPSESVVGAWGRNLRAGSLGRAVSG